MVMSVMVVSPFGGFGLSGVRSRSTDMEPLRVERTLLERIATGDSNAVKELLDRYSGLVWSLARRFTYTEAEAEDAVQEIFVDLWKSSARFDPSVAGEATFIAMISRRRLIDRQRKRSREPGRADIDMGIMGDGEDERPDRAAISEEASIAQRAIETLPEDQRRVLRMSVVRGLSHEKIARATDLPLGTVKTHIRRGLIRVREEIEKNRKDSRLEVGSS